MPLHHVSYAFTNGSNQSVNAFQRHFTICINGDDNFGAGSGNTMAQRRYITLI